MRYMIRKNTMIGLARLSRAVLVGASALLTCVASQALAQTEQSTWQRIMDTKTLRVGLGVVEPYGFRDTTNSDAPGGVKIGDETWRGIVPVASKAIAEAMGVKLQLVETTYANAVAGLQAGQYDVFFPLDATPRRAMAVDFLPTPLLWYPMTVLTRVDLDDSVTWDVLNDPKYRIATVLGAQTDIFATAYTPKARITRYQDSEQQLAAVQSGRVDMAIMLSTVSMVAHNKIKMGKIAFPKPEKPFAAGVAIRREADPRWRNYLTTVVQYFYNTGEIQTNFDQFVAFRGIDPKDVMPVIRENWPQK